MPKKRRSVVVRRPPRRRCDPATGTCAVIMAAYRAERWIGAAIRSVLTQERIPGWRVELRVGVDGCSATAAELERLGQPHWRSGENLGPYVMRNSLVALSPADCYAIFDADDVMLPSYLSTLVPLASPGAIAGPGRRVMNERGEYVGGRRSEGRRWQQGVCVVGRLAWDKLGGYRSYAVAADGDLVRRARRLGIRIRSRTEPLYLRRRHGASLTRSESLGMRSSYRELVVQDSVRRAEAGELVVIPETRELEPWP